MFISKKRLFTTTVGIILSVSTIFTAYYIGNSIAKFNIYEYIEKEKIHVFIRGFTNAGNFDIINEKIKNIKYANISGTLKYNAMIEFDNKTCYSEMYYPPNFTIIEGKEPLNKDEISLMNDTANCLGVKIGDYVKMLLIEDYPEKDVRVVKVVGIHNGKSNFILPFEAIKDINSTFILEVRYDVDYLLNSPDLNSMKNKMREIENGIVYEISPYCKDISTDRNIFIETSPAYIIFPLIFSLPVIGIGVYLSKVGIEIEIYERRRLFGTLKVRGASKQQIAKILVAELIIYSVIGGIIGYIFGEFIAYLITKFTMGLSISFIIKFKHILSAIILCLLLLSVSSYKPWKALYYANLPSLLEYYSEKFEKIEYKASKEIITCIIFWLYLIIGTYLFHEFTFEGGLNLVVILASIIFFTFPLLLPIMLFLLPFLTSRLVLLGTSKPYVFIAGKIAKIFGTSGEIAEKGFKRAPRRNASLSFILSFILSISIFVSLLIDNGNKIHEIRNIMEYGGDMKIYVRNYNWSYLNYAMNKCKSINNFAIVGYIEASINGEYTSMGIINISAYKNTVRNLGWFLKKGSFEGLVIKDDFAKYMNIKLNDFVYLEVDGKLKKAKVKGIAYSFPGIYFDALIDNKSFEAKPRAILIKTENIEEAKSEIKSVLKVKYISSDDYEDGNLFEKLLGQQYIAFLLFFVVAIGVASIVVVQYSSFLNRKYEIAMYGIRGASKKQIATLLFTEGLTIVFISLLVGLGVGLALSFVFLQYFIALLELPPIFVFGKYFVYSIISICISYIITHFIIAYTFARRDSQILRYVGER